MFRAAQIFKRYDIIYRLTLYAFLIFLTSFWQLFFVLKPVLLNKNKFNIDIVMMIIWL